MTAEFTPQTPWLSNQEIADLCAPLIRPAAQVAYLKRLGLTVAQKPNGAPLVMRSNMEMVLGSIDNAKHAKTASREPNKQALMIAFGRR